MDNSYPMPFGKHKGTPLVDLPDDYLAWLRATAVIRLPDLGEAVDDEYDRRLRESEHEQPGDDFTSDDLRRFLG